MNTSKLCDLDDYPEYYRDIFTTANPDFLHDLKLNIPLERFVIRALCATRLVTYNIGILLVIIKHDPHSDSWIGSLFLALALVGSFEIGESSHRLQSTNPFYYDIAMARLSGALLGLLLLAVSHSFPHLIATLTAAPHWVIYCLVPLPLVFGMLSYSQSRRYMIQIASKNGDAFAWLTKRHFIKMAQGDGTDGDYRDKERNSARV